MGKHWTFAKSVRTRSRCHCAGLCERHPTAFAMQRLVSSLPADFCWLVSSLKPSLFAADMQTVEAPHKTQTLGELTRPQFPILHQEVNGKPLIYLDNSATSQKPNQVRQAMEEYYGPTGCNSNVHRGVHNLSSRATAAYEQARDKIANFIHARASREIVFVKNASEGINLIANTWGTANIKQDDEVSIMSPCLFSKFVQNLIVNHKLTSALHADYSVSSRASQQPGAMAHACCEDRCKAALCSTDQGWHRTGHGGTP